MAVSSGLCLAQKDVGDKPVVGQPHSTNALLRAQSLV